ncbi:MAG: hypothetical protein ACXWAT_10995 [Methylobacter sp.]
MSRTAGWTYGVLDSHLGTFVGRESREAIETTFLKPLVSYITKTDTTVKWTGQPAIEIRRQQVQFMLGAHYYRDIIPEQT